MLQSMGSQRVRHNIVTGHSKKLPNSRVKMNTNLSCVNIFPKGFCCKIGVIRGFFVCLFIFIAVGFSKVINAFKNRLDIQASPLVINRDHTRFPPVLCC